MQDKHAAPRLPYAQDYETVGGKLCQRARESRHRARQRSRTVTCVVGVQPTVDSPAREAQMQVTLRDLDYPPPRDIRPAHDRDRVWGLDNRQ